MAGVTIPAKMHRAQVDAYQREYEAEFGALDRVQSYTREELADKYARDLRFWMVRVPEVSRDDRPSTETLCAHAIATNAVANMKKMIVARDLEHEVRVLLRDVYERSWD